MTALLSEDAEAVMSGYRARLAAETELMRADMAAARARIDDFLIPIGEEVGEVLGALIVARGARHIVEIGTSYGFSTIYLASAAARTGGVVHTLDIAAHKQAYAREKIAQAGLSAQVEWHLGDAVQTIARLADGVEFALIDLWKDLYVPCFQALHPKLAPAAIVAGDNIIFPPEEKAAVEAYRACVRGYEDMESALLAIGQGIELSSRRN